MPRKQRKAGVWDDLDRRLDATDRIAREFFSDAHAVAVENIPSSQLELSDEEITDHTVEVRVDSDGFVSEVPEQESAPAEPLELMPVPAKLGVTEWGGTFGEVHARVQEFQCVSRPTSQRYVVRAHGNVKVSSLPSGIDFCADVCVVARRVLTPSLFHVWNEIYYEGFGAAAHRVPEAVQSTIMQLCVDAWKRAGLLPFRSYWNERVDLHDEHKQHRTRMFPIENVLDARAERNKRRRARRAEKRAAISVYEAAA